MSGLVITTSDLLAFEAINWSPSVNGLRLGLRLEINEGNSLAVVFLNNIGPIGKGVFVSQGLVKRFEFIAVSPDGKEYVIRQRAEYVPCAGLCYWPLIDNLGPSQTQRLEFATKDLIYIPDRAPITELGTLLSRGYSIRASFAVTDKDLQEALNRDLIEGSWRGQLVSPQVRTT